MKSLFQLSGNIFSIHKTSTTALQIGGGLALALLTLLASPAVKSEPSFIMAFGRDPDQDPQYRFYAQIYSEAFKELGYQFSYKVMPSKRSSLNANLGKVDGEPQRIASYNQTYRNMVRVEEPIFINRTIAITLNPEIRLNGLDSLKDMPYRVDYLRGSVWSRENLQPLVPEDQLTSVDTASIGLNRLKAGRTDIFIGLEVVIHKQLQDPEFRNLAVRQAGVIGQNYSYPFVHNMHLELAPKLNEVLLQMKNDGRYNQFLFQNMPYLKEVKHSGL
ncbi:substrate-binding periplasmic protein [Oceanospirillum sanctuarii]|uniref:substrate-binding periplasmic protein n=1 Tax=Oceanospirillum sanctuarii TaxID=1434821 RepID=UPI000A381544|nr:transporter substrate-binding domain-containing protein [Oceanospirillum sanctuarii]